MKRLLIVEDNRELQDLLSERFSHEHLQIFQAFSAEEGMEIIQKTPPDMVLLDLMLPGKLSGHGLLAWIKNDPVYRNTQIAIFSNLDNPYKATFSLQNIDYMLKADTPLEDVVKVVRSHLGGVTE